MGLSPIVQRYSYRHSLSTVLCLSDRCLIVVPNDMTSGTFQYKRGMQCRTTGGNCAKLILIFQSLGGIGDGGGRVHSDVRKKPNNNFPVCHSEVCTLILISSYIYQRFLSGNNQNVYKELTKICRKCPIQCYF